MELLDLFPQIELEFLTITPCVNNKVHLEIGLVKDRDNTASGRPANFKRAHAKFCIELTKYFKKDSTDTQEFTQHDLTTHCTESQEIQPQITEPEAAAIDISEICADLTQSDLDIAKDIQLCLCDQCEFERDDLDFENESLFETYAISDAELLTDIDYKDTVMNKSEIS